MEENYIQIFCSFVADLLERDKFSMEDMEFIIVEFTREAPNIHSRQDLINFISNYPDYPELNQLVEQLKDSHHQFIFNQQ